MYLFLFYVTWCFGCIYVCVSMSDILELELENVLSWELNTGPLEEWSVLLTTELYSSSPCYFLLCDNLPHVFWLIVVGGWLFLQNNHSACLDNCFISTNKAWLLRTTEVGSCFLVQPTLPPYWWVEAVFICYARKHLWTPKRPPRSWIWCSHIGVSLFKLEVGLPTNPDTAGRWSPEPSFRQAFIEARRGYPVWYKSDWWAFNIIGWCWEPNINLTSGFFFLFVCLFVFLIGC